MSAKRLKILASGRKGLEGPNQGTLSKGKAQYN
jgi:hypothetical protein